MLNHLSIVGDQSLDKETKRQNLESLEQALPEDVRAVRQQVTLHGNLYEQAKTMKAEGASNEEVFQLRAVSLGEDAARAMAKLDADRALWQQRLTNYSQQRNIINDSGLSKQDQLLAINDLIETNFSGTERLRVKALSSSL
jgi:lipase chaperone LimK